MQTSDQKKLEEAITWEQDKDLGTRQRPGNKAKTWEHGGNKANANAQH